MKLIITFLFCLCSLLTIAQTDTTKTKTVDSVSKKIFYLMMPVEQWQGLINIISSADEKPSVVNAWKQLIANNLQEFKIDTTKTQVSGKPKK